MSEEKVAAPVKNWFLRSVSFGGLHGATTATTMPMASKGLSECKHAPLDQSKAMGGLNVNLRELSLRRIKTSCENERDSLPMVPRNVTPLTPLTPLRWKSSACDKDKEEEEEKDTNAQLKFFEDAASESPSGQDTKVDSGEDVMTMTIDFLRARLLSERSASKAAKQQIQELETKVTNLELKLNDEVEKTNKAEKSAEEALLKLLTGNFSRAADCTAKSLQHVNSGSGFSAGEETKEELLESRTNFMGSSLGSRDSGRSLKKNNIATIEKRIQKTWSQMSADMSALAEGGRQSEQLVHWTEKAPALLQDLTTSQNFAFTEMQSSSVNGGQQKTKGTTQVQDLESREFAPPLVYCERGAEGKAHGVAPTSQSAEEVFKHDHGGAHPIQDDRDGLDQTSTGSHDRQRERDEPHRSYRRDHRRSRSTDRSTWLAEEDCILRDMPHSQKNREEMFARRTSSGFSSDNGRRESPNGMTRHHSLNAKTNGSVQYMLPAKEPVSALEPKLLLGYGPAFDAPRERASSPLCQQGQASYNSITDVLLALRKAKASIQNSSSDRAHFMHPQRAS